MKIVGIDPGSTNLGVAILTIDKKFNIIDIKAYNIFAKDIYNRHLNIEQGYNDLRAGSRMRLIMEGILELLSDDMAFVSIEASFYNAFRPAAYAVLLAQMTMITDALTIQYPYTDVYKHPPGVIKKAIKVKSHKGKDPVTDAIRALGLEKLLSNAKSLDDLSEHAVDAIGIAYTGYLSHI